MGRPLTSISELQAALPADSALLEYYLGEGESYLWVVQRKSLHSFRLPARASLDALAARASSRFGAILERRRSPQAQAAFETDFRRLSTVLLGPLAGIHLPARLVLVLDSALNRIPMAALQPPFARQPLGLDHDLIGAPSAAALLAAKTPRPSSAFSQSAVVIADPVFGPGDTRLSSTHQTAGPLPDLPRLPFASELRALRSVLPPDRLRVLQGFDASRTSLRQANLADFALLHFSTHAFIDNHIPELSRVVLSLVDPAGRRIDGYLYPYDFADFRLNGSAVVLSSCETGLGKEVLGEGLQGFAGSLFSAGASQLVLTLTKVDAESSSAFFAETYLHFFGAHPASLEKSLTLARLTLAHSVRWSDPYYWAPFIVMGGLSRGK